MHDGLHRRPPAPLLRCLRRTRPKCTRIAGTGSWRSGRRCSPPGQRNRDSRSCCCRIRILAALPRQHLRVLNQLFGHANRRTWTTCYARTCNHWQTIVDGCVGADNKHASLVGRKPRIRTIIEILFTRQWRPLSQPTRTMHPQWYNTINWRKEPTVIWELSLLVDNMTWQWYSNVRSWLDLAAA